MTDYSTSSAVLDNLKEFIKSLFSLSGSLAEKISTFLIKQNFPITLNQTRVSVVAVLITLIVIFLIIKFAEKMKFALKIAIILILIYLGAGFLFV